MKGAEQELRQRRQETLRNRKLTSEGTSPNNSLRGSPQSSPSNTLRPASRHSSISEGNNSMNKSSSEPFTPVTLRKISINDQSSPTSQSSSGKSLFFFIFLLFLSIFFDYEFSTNNDSLGSITPINSAPTSASPSPLLDRRSLSLDYNSGNSKRKQELIERKEAIHIQLKSLEEMVDSSKKDKKDRPSSQQLSFAQKLASELNTELTFVEKEIAMIEGSSSGHNSENESPSSSDKEDKKMKKKKKENRLTLRFGTLKRKKKESSEGNEGNTTESTDKTEGADK